jgi:DNA (cytosine-5)-methyltransferase 1
MLKIGSLCTGYGGLDMAVEAYFNAETIWTCEYDKHASKVIEERISKPNYGDLKTTDWSSVEPIDILTAGYPCQPFSHAGLRKGAEDERHLWPYIKEIIRQLRPSYVILENVRGHFGLGFREVLGDLTSIGYDARWKLVRASDVGAPHRRERLFIFAYPNGHRQQIPIKGQHTSESKSTGFSDIEFTKYTHTHSERCSMGQDNCNEVEYQRQPQFVASGLVKTVATNSKNRSDGCLPSGVQARNSKPRSSTNTLRKIYSQEIPPPLVNSRLNVKFVEYMMGLPEGWVTDVDLPRSQMLKILGNGVVPQQAYRALQLLVNNL